MGQDQPCSISRRVYDRTSCDKGIFRSIAAGPMARPSWKGGRGAIDTKIAKMVKDIHQQTDTNRFLRERIFRDNHPHQCVPLTLSHRARRGGWRSVRTSCTAVTAISGGRTSISVSLGLGLLSSH